MCLDESLLYYDSLLYITLILLIISSDNVY
jgi:hypothetical protein